MTFLAVMALQSEFSPTLESFLKVIGDVAAHFGAYLVLTFLFYFSIRAKSDSIKLILSASCSLLYSLVLETTQLGVPGRSFSIKDIFVNMIAVLIAATLLAWRNSKKAE